MDWWTLVVAVIGAIAAVISAWVVVADRVRQKRRVEHVQWMFEYAGDAKDQNGTIVGHVARLANVGSSAATIISSGITGTTRTELNNPLPGSAFPPGRTETIMLDPCNVDDVWLLIMYRDARDARYVRCGWEPFTGGHLQSELDRQVQALPRSTRALRRLLSRPAAVGPGGVPFLRLRTDRPELEAALESAWSLAVQAGATSLHR